MASVGSIVGGGFRLIANRPVSVLVWAVVNVAVSVASGLLMASTMTGMLGAGAGAAPDPQAVLGMMGPMLLFYLLMIFLNVVLMSAAYRAVLRPEEGGFASLRLGGDELRLFGLFLIVLVGGLIAYFILVLLGMFLTMGIALVLQDPGVVAVVAILLYLAMLALVVFVWVRLSLMFPLTFIHRRLVFDEAWTLSRGRFWTLFLAYLVLLLITIAIYIVALLPMFGPLFQAMAEAGSNPQALQEFQARQLEQQFGQPIPMMILAALLPSVAAAVVLALNAGAGATAARDLLRESGSWSEDDVDRAAAIFE